jgi:tRNA(Ile)-lysidine synthase
MPRSKTDNPVTHVRTAFEQACGRLGPLRPGARLLLGCSAGSDSMSLLDLAAWLAPSMDWHLAIAHIDHNQRQESADEAHFVTEQACRHGFTTFIQTLHPEANAPLTEDAMRQARLAAFRRFSGIWQADALLLAHQADDRAETFIIRLTDGSGPTGLASIRPIEQVEGLMIVRPLLDIRRRASLENKRSWVRHDLLPRIAERIGLDPTERIVRASALIGEEAAALSDACRILLAGLTRPAPDGALACLDVKAETWREASPILQRQLLRQWLWSLRRGPHPPGLGAVEEALAFAQRAQPGSELRTVEQIHVIHCKKMLVAFAPDVDESTRKSIALPLIPARRKRKKKTQ